MPRSSLNDVKDLVADLPTRDLVALLTVVRKQIAERRSDSMPDVEITVREAMQRLFSDRGVDKPYLPGHGLVVLGGQVQEYGRDPAGRQHKCQLFTVMEHDESSTEMWAWDDGLESLIHADTSKVGNCRRSVAILAATPGMMVVRHRMSSDGFRHSRTSVTAWRVEDVSDDGDVRLVTVDGWVPATLPPPHGGSATPAAQRYAGRGR